jgi:hypothetical protein
VSHAKSCQAEFLLELTLCSSGLTPHSENFLSTLELKNYGDAMQFSLKPPISIFLSFDLSFY